MQTLRHLGRELLFFLNHLGAEGPPREVVIRLLATGLMYLLAGIVLYISLRMPDGRQVLLCALGSAVVAVLVGKSLNQLVIRDRPFVVFPDEVRHIALIVRPDSFPSIHAVAAFGLVGGVLLGRYRRVGVIMLALASAMIAARVAAGVHWPSDVVGGGLIALFMAALFMVVQRRYWPRVGLRKQQNAELDGRRYP